VHTPGGRGVHTPGAGRGVPINGSAGMGRLATPGLHHTPSSIRASCSSSMSSPALGGVAAGTPASAWTSQAASLCRSGDVNGGGAKLTPPNRNKMSLNNRLALLDTYAADRNSSSGGGHPSPPVTMPLRPVNQTPYRPPRRVASGPGKETKKTEKKTEGEKSGEVKMGATEESQELEDIFMDVMDELNL